MQGARIDVAAVDVDRIVTVSVALGAQRFGELLSILSTRMQLLSAAIEMLPAEVADIVSALHQSRGSAVSLGLVGLSSALTDIEAQIARMLGGSALPDAATLACVKIAGRALNGYWRATSQAAARHVGQAEPGQAPGTSSK